MRFALRRRGPSNFQRAAEGSMTLMEHLQELRMRLFRASLAVVAGFVVGMVLAQPVFELLQEPYCSLPG
ncbi:MAG: twin-arginine translocase subunit TatC, partial [Actinobacteria bacterium]